MKHWKASRTAWLDAHPYRGPYATFEEAEAWAREVRNVHTDNFEVERTQRGFEVTQDFA